MNAKKLLLIPVLFVSALATSKGKEEEEAEAPSFKHEITAATSALALTQFSYEGYSEKPKVITFVTTLGYYMSVNENLQLGINPALQVSKEKNTKADYLFSVLAGPRFNVMSAGESLNSALFFDAMVGTGKADNYGPDFRFQVAVGKRFPLAENVTFTPEVNYTFMKGDGATTNSFSVTLLQLSVLLR